MKYYKSVLMNRQKNAHFQSKRKMEFEYLMKQKVYRETVIKVRLPNELVVEGSFGPLEKLQSVFDLVAEVVAGDLYLFDTPPVKRLEKEMGRTLAGL